ncbi:hypothetical protein I4F81_009930 [Pyropia yezoensis]|uniref:Uncharacterized protein n=1 Tax=Pyropia yezoensis TaxID=2788 RepID=A0ACC3CC88_PYRYE|nr:hypothetical protein I4F81_009930 [Neopyropia yezoensis]
MPGLDSAAATLTPSNAGALAYSLTRSPFVAPCSSPVPSPFFIPPPLLPLSPSLLVSPPPPHRHAGPRPPLAHPVGCGRRRPGHHPPVGCRPVADAQGPLPQRQPPGVPGEPRRGGHPPRLGAPRPECALQQPRVPGPVCERRGHGHHGGGESGAHWAAGHPVHLEPGRLQRCLHCWGGAHQDAGLPPECDLLGGLCSPAGAPVARGGGCGDDVGRSHRHPKEGGMPRPFACGGRVNPTKYVLSPSCPLFQRYV